MFKRSVWYKHSSLHDRLKWDRATDRESGHKLWQVWLFVPPCRLLTVHPGGHHGCTNRQNHIYRPVMLFDYKWHHSPAKKWSQHGYLDSRNCDYVQFTALLIDLKFSFVSGLVILTSSILPSLADYIDFVSVTSLVFQPYFSFAVEKSNNLSSHSVSSGIVRNNNGHFFAVSSVHVVSNRESTF